MDENNKNDMHQPFKIPSREQLKQRTVVKEEPPSKSQILDLQEDGMFYEIEYSASPIPGVGKFVLRSEKVEEPEDPHKHTQKDGQGIHMEQKKVESQFRFNIQDKIQGQFHTDGNKVQGQISIGNNKSIQGQLSFDDFVLPERHDIYSQQKKSDDVNSTFKTSKIDEHIKREEESLKDRNIPFSDPRKDELRELFRRMRDISREHYSGVAHSRFDSSRFFDVRVQRDNGIVFYKQGMFMKDFIDDYQGDFRFQEYFPYYQMMGYEQLRTYFTWRTKVRNGVVEDTSLSYVFLYIYELLSNIGVESPEDGLIQLMTFWKSFREFNQSIDKYVIRWLKDYHIYYKLPHSFKEFAISNELEHYYPNLLDEKEKFDLYCSISSYNISKSSFYNDNKELMKRCFYHVLTKITELFHDMSYDLEKIIFHPTKKMPEWKPFKDALFYNWLKQEDRQIVLSEKEIYICKDNKWSYNKSITSEHGRHFIGYLIKQMEVALRQVTKYKYKLSATMNPNTKDAISSSIRKELDYERIITDAVTEFYVEENKTVVVVDPNALSRIRKEAFVIQEKLVVPESVAVQTSFIMKDDEVTHNTKVKATDINQANDKNADINQTNVNNKDMNLTNDNDADVNQLDDNNADINQTNDNFVDKNQTNDKNTSVNQTYDKIVDVHSYSINTINTDIDKMTLNNHQMQDLEMTGFDGLKNQLTSIELGALRIIYFEEENLKKYADECGIMLEVLVDGINEKAMDFIGDNLLDDEFILYEDYKDDVKDMIG